MRACFAVVGVESPSHFSFRRGVARLIRYQALRLGGVLFLWALISAAGSSAGCRSLPPPACRSFRRDENANAVPHPSLLGTAPAGPARVAGPQWFHLFRSPPSALPGPVRRPFGLAPDTWAAPFAAASLQGQIPRGVRSLYYLRLCSCHRSPRLTGYCWRCSAASLRLRPD